MKADSIRHPCVAAEAATRSTSAGPARPLVVTPTYNERENLEEFVGRVWLAVPGAHILVVDDNSPDGTGALADELARRHAGRLWVLHREKKCGLGRAYVAGFHWALGRDYGVIVQMDADLSHDPVHLPALLAGMDNHALVLGSRYLHGVNVINWDFKRLLLSKCASLYVRTLTGMPFTDPTGGYKCWRREALEAIDLDALFADGYLFQVETTFEAWRRGCSIAEVPIVFFERKTGESKMDGRVIREAAYGVVRIASRRLRPGFAAVPALTHPAAQR
jgi:dolichol-phosphate mannosyltransferase